CRCARGRRGRRSRPLAHARPDGCRARTAERSAAFPPPARRTRGRCTGAGGVTGVRREAATTSLLPSGRRAPAADGVLPGCAAPRRAPAIAARRAASAPPSSPVQSRRACGKGGGAAWRAGYHSAPLLPAVAPGRRCPMLAVTLSLVASLQNPIILPPRETPAPARRVQQASTQPSFAADAALLRRQQLRGREEAVFAQLATRYPDLAQRAA